MIMDSGLGLNLNLQVKTASVSSSEPSVSNITSLTQTNDYHSSSPNNGNAQSPLLLGKEIRATELLIQVLVHAESYKAKVYDLAVAAAEELIEMACILEPLWIFDEDKGIETLNISEYKRRYVNLDSTLEEIIRLIKKGEPTELSLELTKSRNFLGESGREPDILSDENGKQSPFQTEATRASTIVFMSPINIVDVFIDAEQWSLVFHDIVSKVSVLGFFSSGEELGNPNGTLQVMKTELQVASPLVKTREIYFARYCKQMSAADTWIVVDISLESVFPNLETHFQRKPSGCLIQGLENGFSKVTWIEHNEVNYNCVRNLFSELVSSAFAFSAKRWVATLHRQCERLKLLMEDDNDGRKSLLQVSQRISRSYNEAVRTTSTDNRWRPMPNADNILVKTSFNLDDPGKPQGVIITVATSVKLPIPPIDVFEFLRSASNRNKWDILSKNAATQDLAHFATGRDPSNRLSIVLVQPRRKKLAKFYLQESYTDETGYYIVYAPIDDGSLKAILKGGNPESVAILGSGFTVFPENPMVQTRETGGSILTIMFQIADEHLTSPEYLPPQLVATLYNLVAGTISMIQSSV